MVAGLGRTPGVGGGAGGGLSPGDADATYLRKDIAELTLTGDITIGGGFAGTSLELTGSLGVDGTAAFNDVVAFNAGINFAGTDPVAFAGPLTSTALETGAVTIVGTDTTAQLYADGDSLHIRNAPDTAYLDLATGAVHVHGGLTVEGLAEVDDITVSGTLTAATITGLTKASVGLGNVDNTADAAKPVSTATQTALDLKANLASPTFTGTVAGITKAMVGLGSVDNTTDAAKPVSTATQTALDLKAPIASPTFTGTVSGISKSMVGLGNVDNTTDAAKPVSTAQQTALDAKVAKAGDTMTGALNMATGSANGLVFAGDTNLYRSAADLLRTDDVFQPAALYSASVGGTAAANLTLCADLTAANGRLYLAGSGTGSVLTWLDSAGSNGVSIGRTAANTLGTSGNLSVGADLAVTGAVSGAGFTKTLVGLGNADNTSDANKPVSTATQTALDLKAPIASPTFTGTATFGSVAGWSVYAPNSNAGGHGIYTRAGTTTNYLFSGGVYSDTNTRMTIEGTGRISIGDGSGTRDTNVYRGGANQLWTDDIFYINNSQAALYSLYVNNLNATGMGAVITVGAATNNAYVSQISGDTVGRLVIDANGKHFWGAGGSNTADTTLYRSAADTLRTDDTFVAGAGLQTTGITMSAAIVDLVAATSTTAYYLSVSGDANARLSWDGTGKLTWGTGAATGDVTLYRGGNDLLKTDDAMQISTSQSGVFALTVQNTHASGHGLSLSSGTSTNYGFGSTVVGDNFYRYIVDCAGKIQWGDGNVSVDTSLYRDGVDLLRTNDEMRVDLALTAGYAAASTANVKLGAVGPSSQACVLFGGDINLYRSSSTVLQCDKSLYATTNIAARSASGQGAVTLGNVGTGSTAGILFGTDTSMYRSAADTLKTDDALIVGGSVGFYGGAATAKQSVTGSRSANAALASLLTALAAIGLITDSSSA